MRAYTAPERIMLLLFAGLGEEKPVEAETFLRLSVMLDIMGPSESDRELDLAELRRLGAGEDEAELILRRLDREEALDLYLAMLHRRGIQVITRISPDYPARLRNTLGSSAPMLLYCAGDLSLFNTECVSLVGSRRLREPGRRFARTLGHAAAAEGLTYVSGGAAGADNAGYKGVMEREGKAILFLPDSLERRMARERDLMDRILLVSESGTDEKFSIARAYSRNRLIHAMGRKTFVAQADYGAGGTWQGVMENLRYGWSPLFLCGEEPGDPAMTALRDLGCRVLRTGDLRDLRALEPEQTSLFDT